MYCYFFSCVTLQENMELRLQLSAKQTLLEEQEKTIHLLQEQMVRLSPEYRKFCKNYFTNIALFKAFNQLPAVIKFKLWR